MPGPIPELIFTKIVERDVPELTQVMAFDDDSRKHLGAANSGPPGYGNGGFFRKWLFGQSVTEGWKILADGVVAGGMNVWILPDGDNFLETIFVDPDFQNRGMGSAAWKFIEEKYPQTKSWPLSTPKEAVKNHFFTRRNADSTGWIRTGSSVTPKNNRSI